MLKKTEAMIDQIARDFHIQDREWIVELAIWFYRAFMYGVW